MMMGGVLAATYGWSPHRLLGR